MLDQLHSSYEFSFYILSQCCILYLQELQRPFSSDIRFRDPRLRQSDYRCDEIATESGKDPRFPRNDVLRLETTFWKFGKVSWHSSQ
jgi:hypothetical protein